MLDNLKGYSIVLGSQSPRRQSLLKGLELDFTIEHGSGDESFPEQLVRQEIPIYLSDKKSSEIAERLSGNYLLITCDTIVWLENQVLNKPQNRDEAVAMLNQLSGKTHTVYTGVTLKSQDDIRSFYDETKVHFKELEEEEINYYIDKYKPYDKAGSYGVQEWLGYIAIDKIEGCFFNVMGLPLNKLYDELKYWPICGN